MGSRDPGGHPRAAVIETEGDNLVIVKRTVTPEQRVRLVLADNRSTDLSTWDVDRLETLGQGSGERHRRLSQFRRKVEPNRSTAFAIAIDSTGSAYVTGETADMTFPTTPDAFQTTLGRTVFQFHEGTNAFVTKFTPDGSALLYSTSCCAKTRPMGYAALRE